MNVLLTLRVASTLHEYFAEICEASPDIELRETKDKVYEKWGGINRAFEQVITALNKLQKTRGDNG